MQASKLNDLSENSSKEIGKKKHSGRLCKIGNKVTMIRLSKTADEIEEAKLNQMKNTKSNPDVTPCFKCGNRAKYSAECGCRLHSGLVLKLELCRCIFVDHEKTCLSMLTTSIFAFYDNKV